MDKRLLTCVKLCGKGGRVADVGTDHGYLPCYMIKNGLAISALACDIAPMPLKSAEEHITACGLGDKIQTVLSDGLENVQPDGVTDVVIAGMGGEMIAKILSRCDWVKNPNVNLVLQPMTKWDYLRKWLYDNGFEVTEELPCEEGRFVYSVMRVRFNDEGKHDGECDLEYLYFGRVSPDSEEGKKYFLRQAERLETAGRGMLKSPDKFELGKQMLDLADKIKSRI